MKEYHVINILEKIYEDHVKDNDKEYVGKSAALAEAVKALTEIQWYRAIGTVGECREAVERRKPMVPVYWGEGCDGEGHMIYDMYDCPNCGESYENDYDDYKYCPICGQAMLRRF